jgi:hypothetical protein
VMGNQPNLVVNKGFFGLHMLARVLEVIFFWAFIFAVKGDGMLGQ